MGKPDGKKENEAQGPQDSAHYFFKIRQGRVEGLQEAPEKTGNEKP